MNYSEPHCVLVGTPSTTHHYTQGDMLVLCGLAVHPQLQCTILASQWGMTFPVLPCAFSSICGCCCCTRRHKGIGHKSVIIINGSFNGRADQVVEEDKEEARQGGDRKSGIKLQFAYDKLQRTVLDMHTYKLFLIHSAKRIVFLLLVVVVEENYSSRECAIDGFLL